MAGIYVQPFSRYSFSFSVWRYFPSFSVWASQAQLIKWINLWVVIINHACVCMCVYTLWWTLLSPGCVSASSASSQGTERDRWTLNIWKNTVLCYPTPDIRTKAHFHFQCTAAAPLHTLWVNGLLGASVCHAAYCMADAVIGRLDLDSNQGKKKKRRRSSASLRVQPKLLFLYLNNENSNS